MTLLTILRQISLSAQTVWVGISGATSTLYPKQFEHICTLVYFTSIYMCLLKSFLQIKLSAVILLEYIWGDP